MLEKGTQVFAATNIALKTATGSDVAVRWGDPGKILDAQDGSKSLNVCWLQSRITGQAVCTKVAKEHILLEPVAFLQGQWVQFTRDMRFRSNRIVQRGSLGVVVDVRIDIEPCTVLVRAAPMGGQASFELSVRCEDVEPASLPHAVEPAGDKLPGHFRAADLVFATEDLGHPSGAPVWVGCGDAGLVFGPGRVAGTLFVRFEARQDNRNPIWISVPREKVSHEPQLCRGRRVRMKTPLSFPDGHQLKAGDVGLLESSSRQGFTAVGGVEGDVVRIALEPGGPSRCFAAPEGSLEVFCEHATAALDEREARLAELEGLAQANDDAGRQLLTVSMLEQNIWGPFGFGSGIGLSFMDGDRPVILANELRCRMLRRYRNDGLDGTLDNESAASFDHQALCCDHSRVQPYLAAIGRAAAGRSVLDIGTGPVCLLSRLCLRAGAHSVDAIEASEHSVKLAIRGFEAEADGASAAATSVPTWAALEVSGVRCRWQAKHEISLHEGDGRDAQVLALYHGMSTDKKLALSGSYNLLVHEILGDFAGTEGAGAVVADIRRRGLLAKDCTCIPRVASTMLAPTSVLHLPVMERLLHRMYHQGSITIEPGIRYRCRYFKRESLLAEPQALEMLDFATGPELSQDHSLEFRTEREGEFDGLHMHLLVDLDGIDFIDCLALHASSDRNSLCSWSTTYIRLLETPISLPACSRILCRCSVNLEEALARYSIAVSVGEVGEEREVGAVKWQGG